MGNSKKEVFLLLAGYTQVEGWFTDPANVTSEKSIMVWESPDKDFISVDVYKAYEHYLGQSTH
jgi:hypothetical protein